MAEVVVVDASLAFKWFVKEDDSDQADALGRTWLEGSVRVAAPFTLSVELTNAVHRRIESGRLEEREWRIAMGRIMQFPFAIEESRHLIPRTLELARQLGQGAVYDSHYLALAESLDCELWTADERFQGAARGKHPRVRLLAEFAPLA